MIASVNKIFTSLSSWGNRLVVSTNPILFFTVGTFDTTLLELLFSES